MIDKKKVIEELRRISEWLFQQWVVYGGDYDAYITVDEAIKLLEEQETIIRCKDCEYSNLYCIKDTHGEWLVECCHPSTDDNPVTRKWNWYCADGEHR